MTKPEDYNGDQNNALAVSTDKKLVASGSFESIYIWDTESGLLVTKLRGGDRWVDRLVFSGNGRKILMAHGFL